MISIKHKVEIACDVNGISVTELASRLGVSQQSLSKRLKTGKFTQDELAHMAKVLGCNYKPILDFTGRLRNHLKPL